jgi:hypothetical protein
LPHSTPIIGTVSYVNETDIIVFRRCVRLAGQSTGTSEFWAAGFRGILDIIPVVTPRPGLQSEQVPGKSTFRRSEMEFPIIIGSPVRSYILLIVFDHRITIVKANTQILDAV